MIYLFGKKSAVVYSVIALVFIFLGTLMSNDLVWELTDMFNNLMVIPNAIALFALTRMVVESAHGVGAGKCRGKRGGGPSRKGMALLFCAQTAKHRLTAAEIPGRI